MPVFRLRADDVRFPPPELAEDRFGGTLAIGGDVSPERLLEAYTHGIFPWPVEGCELRWVSCDPRFVLHPEDFHVPKSLRRTLKKHPFDITVDRAFEEVIRGCSEAYRPGQDGTWITPRIVKGYIAFHKAGYAHSVETWQDGQLVGGFYGVAVGRVFCGESMFCRVSDASKCAFATMAPALFAQGVRVIDCQDYTDNLARYGAAYIPRNQYLRELREALSDGVASCVDWTSLSGEVGPLPVLR